MVIGCMIANKKVYFVSDVHLGLYKRDDDKLLENMFLAFLESLKNDCSDLVIAGDLFDYWFEYKSVIPKYFYRTLAKFHELRDLGINIIYIMGNHDFGHKDFFEKELNIEIHKTDIERTFFGKRFYLSHGDGKAYGDGLYKVMRSILRNSFAQSVFTKMHPDFGISLASRSSQKSRMHTDAKTYGPREGMIDFAKNKIDEGFDYVVMGHRHIATILPHNNGFYVNLGEWLRKPQYGVFDGNEFKLISLANSNL